MTKTVCRSTRQAVFTSMRCRSDRPRRDPRFGDVADRPSGLALRPNRPVEVPPNRFTPSNYTHTYTHRPMRRLPAHARMAVCFGFTSPSYRTNRYRVKEARGA